MIRTATAADLDAIAALHREARATYYRGHLPDEEFDGPEELARTRAGWSRALARQAEGGQEPGSAVLCADHEGRPAGVAAYRRSDGVMTLTQLHVAPAHWRRGIGTALHDACVAAWRAGGDRTARLEVFDKNTRARDFYTARGWYADPDLPRHGGTHLILTLRIPAQDGAVEG